MHISTQKTKSGSGALAEKFKKGATICPAAAYP
jgi:hypothetical protein